jgi:hypothetical protein
MKPKRPKAAPSPTSPAQYPAACLPQQPRGFEGLGAVQVGDP